MPYNRDIRNFAPLPSGPLPTDEELSVIGRRYRHRHPSALRRAVAQLFGEVSATP